MKSKKLVVLMGKGGVGKSLLARATLCHALRQGIPITAFDGDASNASLARFYCEAQVVDVDGDLQTCDWYETQVVSPLLSDQAQVVLLDLGAGSERLFRRWCSENQAPEVLKGEGIELVLWHVMDPTLDAVSPFLDAVTHLPQVRHVVWFNHGLAKGLDVVAPAKAFQAIEQEPEFIAAIEGRTPLIIPNLQASAQIDAQDLRFEQAYSKESPLFLFERLRVSYWMAQMSHAIGQAL